MGESSSKTFRPYSCGANDAQAPSVDALDPGKLDRSPRSIDDLNMRQVKHFKQTRSRKKFATARQELNASAPATGNCGTGSRALLEHCSDAYSINERR
jgi:hypothetical protein